MNSHANIVVATGLGKVVGDYFALHLDKKLVDGHLRARVIARSVNTKDIISALDDNRRVAEILFHALLFPDERTPEVILIPCNSVHNASPFLKHDLGDAFIPIDEATVSLINQTGRQGRFLILGTSTTVKSGMYQEPLLRLGCESIVLPPNIQASFDDFIFEELVNGKMTDTHLQTLRELELRYMELFGANHVILACTELCYLVQVFSQPLACEVDSLQALHDAGIERIKTLLRKGKNYAN